MKIYNWGILGCGRISNSFAEGLKAVTNARLYAVASNTIGKAEQFAQTHQALHHYSNYDELVNSPDIDIVYIGTTHNFHFENALLALNAGKHVLCEKAVTVNQAQAELLFQAAKKNQCFFMEAMWARFIPSNIEFIKQIHQKEIGALKMLKADFSICLPYNPQNRLYNRELAGGALLDLGVYPITYALMAFDKYPLEIFSHAFIGETKVDNRFVTVFDYGCGEMAILTSSFTDYRKADVEAIGTNGSIAVSEIPCPAGYTISKNNEDPIYVPIEIESNGLNYEAIEVMRCIDQGKLESDIMPWSVSSRIMGIMDTLRSQWGLTYPEDIKVPS